MKPLNCWMVAATPAWCTDQWYRRNGPCFVLWSGDADIARASQLQHAVEDMNRHLDFSRPTLIQARMQPIADDLLPSPDGRLNLRTPVVARGCLPGHTTCLGDTAEVAVALCRRGVSRCAWHCRDPRRHDH